MGMTSCLLEDDDRIISSGDAASQQKKSACSNQLRVAPAKYLTVRALDERHFYSPLPRVGHLRHFHAFESQVYGKSPGRPEKMSYGARSIARDVLGGKAAQKEVTVFFAVLIDELHGHALQVHILQLFIRAKSPHPEGPHG